MKKKKKLILCFFGVPNCSKCEELKKITIPKVMKIYRDEIDYKCYPIDKLKNFRLLKKYEKLFNIKLTKPIIVFLGKSFLMGFHDINQKLEETILKELCKKNRTMIFNKFEKDCE